MDAEAHDWITLGATSPRFPTRLLQSFFPIVELDLPARTEPRHIYFWCRTALLEDPQMLAIKESILDYARQGVSEAGTA